MPLRGATPDALPKVPADVNGVPHHVDTRLGSSPRPANDNDKYSGPEIDWAAQNWHDLIPRLCLVAFARLRRLRGKVPSAGEAQDLVNEAIVKTIGGVRTWDPQKCTLFQFLAGVIASEISHAASSPEARLFACEHASSNGATVWPPDVENDRPNQEQLQEWRALRRRLIDDLNRVEPQMARLAELILLHDVTETTELCRLLELEASEVANLRKRMKRAARAYYAENWS
jgi:DNA-directed RNA polymerase specialized sigma24 family protein